MPAASAIAVAMIETSRLLRSADRNSLLAALSHHANFSVGCYCEDEAHCHRSVLRELLAAAGADVS